LAYEILDTKIKKKDMIRLNIIFIKELFIIKKK